jgi:hypothetical protein
MKTDWGTGSTSSMNCSTQELALFARRVHCVASGEIPIVSLFSFMLPNIDWDLTFDLEWTPDGVYYTINGCHDGFPSYSVYLNANPALLDVDNGDINSLWAPCDQQVSRGGLIQ